MMLTSACAGTVRSVTEPRAPETMVRCEGGHPFPVSALRGRSGAERDGEPPARALRQFLSDHDDLPPDAASGYRVFYRGPDEVLFGVGDSPYYAIVGVGRKDGDWRASHLERCWPEVVRAGYEVADWEALGPPEGKRLRVRYTSSTCYRGYPEDPYERTDVSEAEDAVIVSLLIRPLAPIRDLGIEVEEGVLDGAPSPTPEGSPTPERYGCTADGISFDRVIELPSPLGDRRLLDGGWYPPREPSLAPDDYEDRCSSARCAGS